MALRKGSITRSHEHYLRHILLLGQAAPLALNALVKMKESKHRKTINDLIRECRCRTIPPESVHINPDLWSTKTLCDVIRALFRQELSASEPEIMKSVDVINDQITDMDKYAESAALPFEVFEKKWHPLHSSLLELIKDTDSQTKFKCRRMIHSFKLEDIHVNSDLIKKLRETKDVDSHIKIVVDAKLFTEIHGKREGLENAEIQDLGNNDDSQHNTQDEDVDYPNDESTPYATAVFTEQLHDIFVYMDEPAILTCKLNTAKATVRWRKDHTPLKKTETLKFVNDQYSHWLAISNAQLTDTGLYSCVCGNATTSASLKVTAKPLELVRELHVDMEETVFWEHMDILLVCTVNLQARRPVWMHNSNRITDNNRIFASSLELEHKLIIRNARFEDKGEYTVDFGEVTSSTNLIIKGNVDPLQEKKLKEELRKNWFRGALGLTHLKIGLENVADRFIKDQHSEFLTRLSANGTVCTFCTSETLLPFHCKKDCKKKSKCVCMRPRSRMPCPSGFCSRFYDMIMDSHRFFEPLLANTDVRTWNSDPWSVATCYISTMGYKGKKSATEVDCAGLLSLFINDTIFQKYIGEVDINGKTDVFKKAKDARNEIFHNPTYEMSKGQLDDYITLFKNVLEIRDEFRKSPLLTEPGVTPALYSLNELQNHGTDVWQNEERMTCLHKHAMHEETEIIMKAVKEKNRKMRQLEEKIELPFKLVLRIQVLESTSDVLVQANQQIFLIMKVDVARHNNKPNVTTTSTDLIFTETRLTVERILSFMYNVNDTKIAAVRDSGSSVDLKIQCFSCKAIDQMLALINGKKFQEVKFELQKYLQKEDGAEKPYEVVANFSLRSLNNTRKQLYDRMLVKEVTSGYKCVNHTCMQIVSYCSDHDQLCCATCRETAHRGCFRFNQDASLQIDKENNQECLSVTNMIEVYNVRISDKGLESDQYKCTMLKTVKLPNGKFLLADGDNYKIKKLDRVYKLVGYCILNDQPYDVCYTGNKTAAVSLGAAGIQRVSVSRKMKLLDLITVDHYCYGLDCHLDTLYVTSKSTVYAYDKNILHQRVVYLKESNTRREALSHLIVSNDGKLIYLSDAYLGLLTITRDGNLFSVLKNNVLKSASGICLANDGTILVTDENTHSVHQVDYKGERVIGTVITEADSPQKPWSVCYDEQKSRLIVGYFDQDYIKVFRLH